ncbi:MAG: OmpA family protein [Caulobacterales bacterium]|nr:OmpA family protein [Caulobacterales bacterium]
MAVARIDAPVELGPVASAVDDAEGRGDIIEDPALCQSLFDRLLGEGGVAFASGRAVIEKESYPLLDRLVWAAARCRSAQIRVEGHTDASGDPEANQRLSKKRAQAVVDYLILKGVTIDRLSAAGRGDTRPVADNETEEGRARNRRIEIHIEN